MLFMISGCRAQNATPNRHRQNKSQCGAWKGPGSREGSRLEIPRGTKLGAPQGLT